MDTGKLLTFLKKLDENNNKEWFDRNKKEYDALRKEWIAFVDELIAGIAAFDPSIAGLEAKNCIFRINRDVRFSKDKSPYKNNFGAYLCCDGKSSVKAGYYIHMQPGNCFIAGGIYVPEPAVLAAVRQEIDYNLDAFNSILQHKDFRKYFGTMSGDKLSRPPKGYDATHAGIELLKHKSFLAEHKPAADKVSGNYAKYAVGVFKAMHPFIQFMNSALD